LCFVLAEGRKFALQKGGRSERQNYVTPLLQALRAAAEAVLPLDRVVAAEEQPPPPVVPSQGTPGQVRGLSWRTGVSNRELFHAIPGLRCSGSSMDASHLPYAT